MRLYTEQLAKHLYDYFRALENPIPESQIIIGTLEDCPPAWIIQKVSGGENFILIQPFNLTFPEFGEGNTEIRHLYTLNLIVFKKSSETKTFWQDRFNVADEMAQELEKWFDTIEDAEGEGKTLVSIGILPSTRTDKAKVTSAEIANINYQPLTEMSLQMGLELTGIMITMNILISQQRT